jgi:hypothetical protein
MKENKALIGITIVPDELTKPKYYGVAFNTRSNVKSHFW